MTKGKRYFSPRFLRTFLALNALVVVLVGSAHFAKQNQRKHHVEAAALAAGDYYNVDPELILAVMKKESRFNPQARGKAGEIGLMQIMPNTAREWADRTGRIGFDPEKHLWDPETNAHVGTWYLRTGLDLWHDMADPVPYALARYNAGQSRVIRWAAKRGSFIDNIEFDSTRNYVRDVLRTYRDSDKELTHANVDLQ